MSTTTTETIELDDLKDYFQLTDEGADAEWPDARMEVTVRWHPAEPDVGIFSEQADVGDVDYVLDGEYFSDQAGFVDALYALIGEWIEEGPDQVAAVLDRILDEEEFEND